MSMKVIYGSTAKSWVYKLLLSLSFFLSFVHSRCFSHTYHYLLATKKALNPFQQWKKRALRTNVRLIKSFYSVSLSFIFFYFFFFTSFLLLLPPTSMYIVAQSAQPFQDLAGNELYKYMHIAKWLAH